MTGHFIQQSSDTYLYRKDKAVLAAPLPLPGADRGPFTWTVDETRQHHHVISTTDTTASPEKIYSLSVSGSSVTLIERGVGGGSGFADQELWLFADDPFGSGGFYLRNEATGLFLQLKSATAQSGHLPQALDVGHAFLETYQGRNFSAATIKPSDEYGYRRQTWSFAGNDRPPALVAFPPISGLAGASNYFVSCPPGDLFTASKVTVKLASDLIIGSGSGFSLQLDAYGPAAAGLAGDKLEVWQQYVIRQLQGGTSLYATVNNFTLQEYVQGAAAIPGVDDNDIFASLAKSNTVPAGTVFDIELSFDPRTSAVIGATFTVTLDGQVFSKSVDLTQGQIGPSLIFAYQVLIVGDGGGDQATFESGSGTITYASSNGLYVYPDLNFQYYWDQPDSGSPLALDFNFGSTSKGTGETSNMRYGFLPSTLAVPSTSLVQNFGLGGGFDQSDIAA